MNDKLFEIFKKYTKQTSFGSNDDVISERIKHWEFDGELPKMYFDVLSVFGYSSGHMNIFLKFGPDRNHFIYNVCSYQKDASYLQLSNNIMPFKSMENGDVYCYNLKDVDNSTDYEPIYLIFKSELSKLTSGQKPNYQLDPKEYENNNVPYFIKTKYSNLLEWVEDGLNNNWDHGEK